MSTNTDFELVYTSKKIKENFFINPRFMKKINSIDKFPLTIIDDKSRYNMQLTLDFWLKDRGNVHFTCDYDGNYELFWNEIFKILSKVDSKFKNTFTHDYDKKSNNVRESFKLLNIKNKIYIVTRCRYFFPTYENPFHFFDTLKMLPDYVRIIAIMDSQSRDYVERNALDGITNFIEEKDFLLDFNDIENLASINNIVMEKPEIDTLLHKTKGSYVSIYAFFEMKKVKEDYTFTHNTKFIADFIEANYYLGEIELIAKAGLLTSFNFDEFVTAVICDGADVKLERYRLKLALKRICSRGIFIYYDNKNRLYTVYKGVEEFSKSWLNSGKIKSSSAKKLAKILLGRKQIFKALEVLYQKGMYEEILKQEFTLTELSLSCVRNDKKALENICLNCIKYVSEDNVIVMMRLLVELFLNGNTHSFEYCVEQTRIRLPKTATRNIRGEMFLLESFSEKKILSSTVVHFRRMYEMVGGESKLIDGIAPFFGGLPNIMYIFYTKLGELEPASTEYEKSILYINKLTKGNAQGTYQLVKADIEYFKGNLRDARDFYEEAVKASDNILGIKLRALAMQVKCSLMIGDFLSISDECTLLRTLFSQSKGSFVDELFELYISDMAIFMGKYEEISKDFYSIKGINRRYKYTSIPCAMKICGAVSLSYNEYKRVERYSDHIIKNTEFGSSAIIFIYANIFNAIAHYKLNDFITAKKSLQTALNAAVLDGISLPFAEFLDYYEDLIMVYKTDQKYSKLINKIIELHFTFKQSMGIIVTGINTEKSKNVTKEAVQSAIAHIYNEDTENPFSVQLTQIEMKCSKLAGKRYKNSDIARELNISENTVKQALFRSFKKLGIRNRQQLYYMVNSKKIEEKQ